VKVEMPMPSCTGVLARAAPLLLGAQARHVEHLLGLLGGGLVVARVVGEPRDHVVRELLVLDPVLLAQLHRVAPELGGQLVHDPLDGERRLRAAGAAVGVGRRLGREHPGADEAVGLHLVDGREHERPEHRHARGDELQVGAHVGEQLTFRPSSVPSFLAAISMSCTWSRPCVVAW
jgi:hypothetical protein